MTQAFDFKAQLNSGISKWGVRRMLYMNDFIQFGHLIMEHSKIHEYESHVLGRNCIQCGYLEMINRSSHDSESDVQRIKFVSSHVQ